MGRSDALHSSKIISVYIGIVEFYFVDLPFQIEPALPGFDLVLTSPWAGKVCFSTLVQAAASSRTFYILKATRLAHGSKKAAACGQKRSPFAKIEMRPANRVQKENGGYLMAKM